MSRIRHTLRAARSGASSGTPRLAAVAGVTVAAAALLVPTVAAASAPASAPAAPTAQTCDGPKPQELTGTGHHDLGPGPAAINIDQRTTSNKNYRDTLWTGDHLQLTVMSIKRHDDIGLEMHPQLDQFLRIESGTGVVKMGDAQHNLTYTRKVDKHSAILVPAGTWHDVVNTGRSSLKLYSIYAAPNHPRNTVHRTKKDAANDPLEKKKCPQDVEASN